MVKKRLYRPSRQRLPALRQRAAATDICINIYMYIHTRVYAAHRRRAPFGVLSMPVHHGERGMSRVTFHLRADVYTSFRRNDRNQFARQLCNIADHAIA